MTCTWKDCRNQAVHPQTAKDGEVWANLCDSHNAEIEKVLTSSNSKAMLRCWILAGGGVDKMAARMTR